MKPRILIVTNAAWNIANFRMGIARALLEAGYEVVAVAPPDTYVQRLLDSGLRYVPMPMNRKGMNPVEDSILLWRLLRLIAREKPVAYLGYTIKPNVYGGIACRWLGVASIHNVAGLGFAFARNGLLSRVARTLYRRAFKKAQLVFFQNEEDRQMMIEQQVVRADITDRLPGSGVDTRHFAPVASKPQKDAAFRAVLCARLLREKGVAEFAEAARLLKAEGRVVDFQLLGPFDHANPSAITPSEVQGWVDQGLLQHAGATHDVREHFAQADVVVLPSFYREGVPRALLEAASMGRPIVTTDSVGCREAVEDGVTGFLCRPNDAKDLAEKIADIMDMSESQRRTFGTAGRERIEQSFDERIVIGKYLAAVDAIARGGHDARPGSMRARSDRPNPGA